MPTAYPAINQLLGDLQRDVRAILGDDFVGLYLYGSLAMGDFDPQRSDIDFVVVTREPLAAAVIKRLELMHRRYATSDQQWAAKLEGLYMPLAELGRYATGGPQLPTVNEGRFFMAGQGSDWIIQRHVLREHETIVAGPSLRPYIEPLSPAAIRQAATGTLVEWWAGIAADPAWLHGRPDYQAFTVQTMCRILVALKTGEAVSKTAAAVWAAQHLEEPWVGLAGEAIAWVPEKPPLGVQRPVAFIRYVLARGNA